MILYDLDITLRRLLKAGKDNMKARSLSSKIVELVQSYTINWRFVAKEYDFQSS